MELNDGYVYVYYGILCTFCILNRWYDKILKNFFSKDKGLEGRWCGERVREWVTAHQKNVLSVPNYKKTLLHGGLWSLLPYLYHFYRCNPKQWTQWVVYSTYKPQHDLFYQLIDSWLFAYAIQNSCWSLSSSRILH